MQILMLSRFYYPHVGGVEKHIHEISKRLIKKGHKIHIIKTSYPKIKFIGLLVVWFQLFKQIGLIRKSDIVHIHDVFIWYLPFRFLFPRKKVFITHHGGQAVYPILKKEIIMKRLASKLSNGTICIGRFIPKHFKVSCDAISYGAVQIPNAGKKENRIVWLGRLEEETGVLKVLEEMKKYNNYKIDFCGDGPLKKECKKAGTVHGFVDPGPFLKKAKICYPVGYLSALEAMANKCKIKVVWNNKLKKDYWQMTPFYRFIKDEDI